MGVAAIVNPVVPSWVNVASFPMPKLKTAASDKSFMSLLKVAVPPSLPSSVKNVVSTPPSVPLNIISLSLAWASIVILPLVVVILTAELPSLIS